MFPLIPRRVCLTLAGHTHGGQVALPLIGRRSCRRTRPIGTLFVTAGVGTSIIPVRFRVPPEIVILTIGAG